MTGHFDTSCSFQLENPSLADKYADTSLAALIRSYRGDYSSVFPGSLPGFDPSSGKSSVVQFVPGIFRFLAF